MLTLTSLSLRSSAIRSSTGATAWQGPHHSAQKSTSTGSPDCSTSFSKVASVTSIAIQFLSIIQGRRRVTRSSKSKNVALYTSLPDARASLSDPADGAGPSGARESHARALGARGDLPAAPRAERRRPYLLLHGRPDHRQQPGGRSPRARPHAEGRLPALQGPPRFRPALSERLRLSGPLGRGRGREVAEPARQARDRGVRARGVRRKVPRTRRLLQRGHDRAVPPPRPVDGLGERLLHVQRHEHRIHLG